MRRHDGSLVRRRTVRKSGFHDENNFYRIAVIPGDGIGKEVVPEDCKETLTGYDAIVFGAVIVGSVSCAATNQWATASRI